MKSNRRALWIILIINLLLIGIGIFLIVFQNMRYKEKWYENTVVNGINVSGYTLEQSKEALTADYKDYRLLIKGRENGAMEIASEDINYQFNVGNDLENIFEMQHERLAIFSKGGNYNITCESVFDSALLEKKVKEDALINGSDAYKIIEPQSAYVDYFKEKGCFGIRKEVYGNRIRVKKFLETVSKTLSEGKRELDISGEDYDDLYKEPKRKADNKKLKEEVSVRNEACVRYLVWDLGGGRKETITPKRLGKWVDYQDGEITYNTEEIENWVEAFCLKYKTVGKERYVKIHTGERVPVSGGDFGWRLDYDKVLQGTKEMLIEDIGWDVVDAYVENPTKSNRESITLEREVPYLNTAQVQDYGEHPVDWDKKNYTTVSIEDQMVYVIRDGKVAFSCKCITGLPRDGRETTLGTYFIKEHKEHYVLTGDTYRTPVNHWVRITWMGIGFHPATWQSWSSWTKDKYKTVGSHGCINLSPEDAKKIYELVNYREAVFIY